MLFFLPAFEGWNQFFEIFSCLLGAHSGRDHKRDGIFYHILHGIVGIDPCAILIAIDTIIGIDASIGFGSQLFDVMERIGTALADAVTLYAEKFIDGYAEKGGYLLEGINVGD